MLLNCVFVGLGGAAGSICRYLLGLLPLKPASGFPAITMCINIAGAFALGLIGALAGKYAKLNPQLLLFLRVGVCGGFPTFSTFSVETAGLLQSGKTGLARWCCWGSGWCGKAAKKRHIKMAPDKLSGAIFSLLRDARFISIIFRQRTAHRC